MADRRFRSLTAGLCVLVLGWANARGADDTTVSRLTQEVRRAVVAPPGQSTDSVLLALRQLHDERLRPLFAELASRSVAAARLQGIFGLADLSEDGKVNIVQIASLSSRDLRARALGAAIGADYLTTEQMEQVLTWPELEPAMELLVMSKLLRAGEQPDVTRVREIADALTENEIATKIFAELLIAQAEGTGDASEVQRLLAGVPEQRRESLLGLAYAQIIVDKMSALKEFVVAEHAWAKSRPGIQLQSLATLLAVDPELGVREWQAAFKDEENLSQRIRLGLILLNAAPRVDASAFDPMIGDEVELLDRMGRAGRAVAAHEGEVDAMWSLLQQRHELSLAWVFDALDQMDPEDRITVLRGLMDRGMAERSPGAGVPAALYELARTMESAEPGSIATYLRRAADGADGPLCEAFLAASMESEPHAIWGEEGEPTWPSRRCRVLGAIAGARAGQVLEGEELDLLVSAGRGGEELPPAFRVQAAWLALCQLQKEREALAEVLAPSDE